MFDPLFDTVIFSSYGNDSCALIQWAHENNFPRVAVVYTDTKWSGDGWAERVERMEHWVRLIGFHPFRTSSKGFHQLARDKKGFPTQRYQWCSFILKIEPGMRWLAEHDASCHATCLVGVRRDEGPDRANFPYYLDRSENHGGRPMLAPFVHYTEAHRNALLARADIEPLPHRSRECLCINSNRADMKRFTPGDVARIRDIEAEIGRPMYRPHRHMGAAGIDEVLRWANSQRGGYEPPREENLGGCDTGFCPN